MVRGNGEIEVRIENTRQVLRSQLCDESSGLHTAKPICTEYSECAIRTTSHRADAECAYRWEGAYKSIRGRVGKREENRS